MRELRLLTLKFIDRASKCTKDPNPLGTTMWLMNSKYPLAVNKVSARKHEVLKEYLCPGKPGEDSHKHKLVHAKVDAVQWLIVQSKIPSEEHQRISDIKGYSF